MSDLADVEVCRLQEEVRSLRDENERLQAQLPEGMKHCTIQFKECESGHGRLTASNWIEHGCHWCKLFEAATFLDRVARDLDAIPLCHSTDKLGQAAAECRTEAKKLRGEP